MTKPESGYPEGYRDPPWDGTEEGYKVVLEARVEALAAELSKGLPEGFSLVWEVVDE